MELTKKDRMSNFDRLLIVIGIWLAVMLLLLLGFSIILIIFLPPFGYILFVTATIMGAFFFWRLSRLKRGGDKMRCKITCGNKLGVTAYALEFEGGKKLIVNKGSTRSFNAKPNELISIYEISEAGKKTLVDIKPAKELFSLSF